MIDMSWQDASFIQLETVDTPMHVSYLLLFSLPKSAAADYVESLEKTLLEFSVLSAPFNYRLKPAKFVGRRPQWQPVRNVDIAEHFQRVELPAPGGERELGEYVSGFHSTPLVMDMPLWQIRLIDGLDNQRFGLCIKMHHSMADGLRLLKIVNRCLSSSADQELAPPWAASLADKEPDASHSLNEWRDFFFGMVNKSDTDSGTKFSFPRAPRSIFNGAITGERRVATHSVALDRVKAIAKASDVTLNDVVIAICSKSLREYMQEYYQLPEASLVAGIPIALRNSDSLEYGNALGGMTVSMSTDVEGDMQRFENICTATEQGKKMIHLIPNSVNKAMSVISMYAAKAKVMLKQDLNKATPVSTLTISNLPGSNQALYLHGAQLESIYPASILMPDQRLTIMLISYKGQLNFGFVGCPEHLVHIQKIAKSLENSLAALEHAAGL